MLHVIQALIYIAICYFIGDWRNWRKYYATILFYIAGDLIYNFIAYNRPLWQYASPTIQLGHTLSNLLIMITVFPCTILLFFKYFPKDGVTRKIGYIMVWIIIQSGFERLGYSMDHFTYHNGWSFMWSVLANIILFPTMVLHQYKPLWAIGIYTVTAIAVVFGFNIRITDLK